MTRDLQLTPLAEADLVDVWLFTLAEWGAGQADDYLDRLKAGMDHLTQHPDLGVDYSHVRDGYRKLRIEHHDVFYGPTDSQIVVIRVLHEDLDAPRHLLT